MAEKETKKVTLYGRVFIGGDIKAVTGLHIGGAAGALAIGGVDAPIIRDPITNYPYIPGSSLRGKMRSLTEKKVGAVQSFRIGPSVHVHVCKTLIKEGRPVPPEKQPYSTCPVCPVFGVSGDQYTDAPTRLVVRDVSLSDESVKDLKDARTDLPFSEVKWEATIDRVTSAAVPRQIERVPAGVVFDEFELVYSIYGKNDVDRLVTVIEAMQLLEDDYLGGLGSRGGGKIRFEKLSITVRSTDDYGQVHTWDEQVKTVGDVLKRKEKLLKWVREKVKVPTD